MKLYVYQLHLKPDYHDAKALDAKVQDVFKQHGEFLNRNIQHGRILIVGRTDVELRDNFGLVIFEAENQEDADVFMNADPAVARGIMTARAFPFKLHRVSQQALRWSAT